ncbi:hypothetical protein G7050_02840 [Dysgonomonas sp. HDW5A]|uniref:hypothetical protein n=1 Tax=Dysgonomonas sp. HDW5A TaxID=2714926 RepID=UPI00140AEEDF|nr:hypothetical protein [Dysgonomonas sp. HDW5A]QIK58833.1 hypothetical protein G7050_02840 [Dysgonomonas sp. HDW5A]
MSLQQLKHGVIRCEARLSGVLQFGLMKNETFTREALREYQNELDKRKQTELDFK